jgi:lipopolysaccharide biosynthesis protein
MRTLVLFVFHEYNDRVDYFIKNAIFKEKDIDFVVICNNPILEFSVPDYVAVLKRHNFGHDFGGWSQALFHHNIYKNYDRFIFANSSIVGPYLPQGFTGRWTDIYINGLNDNVKLFGSTINCQFFLRKDIPLEFHPILFTHLQSYIFSMELSTLEYLMKCEIFSESNHSDIFLKTIENKEIGMSRKIIENGWNIGCLMKRYQEVDFRFIYKKPEDYPITFLGDIMFPEYVNNIFTPEELVFIKGNRCPNVQLP